MSIAPLFLLVFLNLVYFIYLTSQNFYIIIKIILTPKIYFEDPLLIIKSLSTRETVQNGPTLLVVEALDTFHAFNPKQ